MTFAVPAKSIPRIVIAAALVGWSGLAAAQTSEKLLSNTGQTAGLVPLTVNNDHAMRFRTGSDSRGYTLTGVDLQIIEGTSPVPANHAYTVSIHADSSSEPGSHLGTLTNPGSWPSAFENVRFPTSGGIRLDPSTDYWVVFDLTAGPYPGAGARSLRGTTSGNADSGAATDWSMGSSLFRSGNTSDWDTTSFFRLFAVYGYAGVPAPEPDPNAAPTVTITAASTTVAPGGTVALKATATDSDGTIVGYQWTAPRGTFSTTTAAETVWTAPDLPGTVDVRVTVRDNGGRRASATVTITVDPESVPALPAAGLALLAFLLAVRGTRHVRTRAVPPAGSRHSANADRPRRAG